MTMFLPGMEESFAYKLAAGGVKSMDDLAELSVDELCEFGDIDETRAAELIMAARAPWFEDAEAGTAEK